MLVSDDKWKQLKNPEGAIKCLKEKEQGGDGLKHVEQQLVQEFQETTNLNPILHTIFTLPFTQKLENPQNTKPMDDFPIDKIQISGATLASLLHRSSSADGDIHGYLFGHASVSTANPLSDHPTTTDVASLLTATVTSFLSLPSHLPLPPPAADSAPLIGSFSARRKTSLRPSMKDTASALSLHADPSFAFTPQNSTLSLPPSLLFLITTPFHDQLIHTHEYRAFQYKGGAFEPKTLDIVNIGPSFRSQFNSFSPSVRFPMLGCELRGSNAMVEDNLIDSKNCLNDQKQLDACAEGFEIGRLSKLMGSEAAYTGELEDLYDKMLAKIDGLSRLVEQSNAKVQEQENHNMKLRCRVAGLE